MATPQLPPDFKEFLQLLNSAKVEYLLVGGYAVGFHGYPRTTGDIDIWIAVHPENAARLAQVLVQFGFSEKTANPAQFLHPHKVFAFGVSPVRIDLLTSVAGVEFAECYPNRVEGLLDGVEVSVISLADLKKNKQSAGRSKDLDDLSRLP